MLHLLLQLQHRRAAYLYLLREPVRGLIALLLHRRSLLGGGACEGLLYCGDSRLQCGSAAGTGGSDVGGGAGTDGGGQGLQLSFYVGLSTINCEQDEITLNMSIRNVKVVI